MSNLGYFTIPEFIEATGGIYQREWVRILIKRGEIDARQSGRGANYRIPASEVSRFLEREGLLELEQTPETGA